MKKSVLVILLLCFILVGCGSKNVEDANTDTGNDNNMVQPTIEGQREVSVMNLKFFLPNELTVNSYNGINNTYNYYMENSDDNCNIYLSLVNASSYDNSISKFMSDYVRLTDYNEEQINNAKWYAVVSSNNVSYSIMVGEYFYNVKTSISQNGTVCSKVNDMIKSTLYVVNE